MNFNIANHPSIFSHPDDIIGDSFWNEHLPFAFFLIDILRPITFVELGLFKGGSYNAFCQAVKEMKAGTKCYGVDNWEGDLHNGSYDISVYNTLADYQRKNYHEFSTLLKMPFDDALANFPDGSIDLLHIDGYHTYEAVKHDYEKWLPKMSERGVVILHDTHIRKLDYGVWKLWAELSMQYPAFEFKHGCGLGILAVGRSVNNEYLEFIKGAKQSEFYSALFGVLGKTITDEVQLAEKDRMIQQQDQTIKQQDQTIKQQDQTIKQRDQTLQQQAIAIKQLNDQIEQIFISKKWQLAVKLSRVSQLIAPQGSQRRRLLKWLVTKLGIKLAN